MITAWTPNEDDILWGELILSLITDGGTWLYPAALQIWVFSHTHKTITITTGPFTVDSEEQVARTRVLFETVFGYKVIDARTRPDQVNPNPN